MARHNMKIKGSHGKAKKGTLLRLIKILFAHYKWWLILAMFCLLINAGTNIFASIAIKNFTNIIEEAILEGKTGWDVFHAVVPFIIILSSIYFVGIFASFGWNRIMAVITQKYLNTLRIQMFTHMETLPIKYFDTHERGDVMSMYTNDTDTIRQLVSSSLPDLFRTIFTVILVIAVMLIYSIYLLLVVIVGSVAMYFVAKVMGGNSSKYFVKQQKMVGKVEGNIEESIKGLKVIKVFTHEEESIKDFDKLNEELCEAAMVANINGNNVGPVIGNIGNILYVLLAIVGSILILTKVKGPTLTGMKVLDIGTALAFLTLSRTYTNCFNIFAQQITSIMMGLAGASRIFELLDEVPEADNGYVTLVHIKKHEDGTFEVTDERTRDFAWKHPHEDGTVTYTELKGDIVFDHVDFGYNPDKIVLHDISLYAHPGQKIAFVGATGAGKTTITNLINRFYDIADGKIRYDGININKIKKADLRHSLGIVLQDTNLFTGTVMSNIKYGYLDATDEEVIEAAKIANAYDFITRLPEGFNTPLIADGANLSQGQRQLLSIARAAVADAPVMILDEATSSIDTRTEKLVQQGMDKLMEGRTVFVIAHRLSTVRNSEAIMVLDHGNIIERGTHLDLIRKHGVYYQLYTGAFELE